MHFCLGREEMVGAVLSWLPAESLVRSGLVCRAWHQAACDDALWRNLLVRDLGVEPAVPDYCNQPCLASQPLS